MLAWTVAACFSPKGPTTAPFTTGDTGRPPTPTAETGVTRDTGTTGDTSVPWADCVDAIAPATLTFCAETTAAIVPGGAYEAVLAEGSGDVTEVGGVLAAVPGSAAVPGFFGCGSQAHQVRLVDGGGDTWTFGWDLDGVDDDASTALIVTGAELDFTVTSRFYGYGTGAGLVLSDATGPLFVFEYEQILTEEQQGLPIELRTDTCEVEPLATEYWQVTFTGSEGSAALWPGQTVALAVGGRDLRVVLGAAEVWLDCTDWCSDLWWAGWAESR